MTTYAFNTHTDITGTWCRWSGVSVTRVRKCPYACPDSTAVPIDGPETTIIMMTADELAVMLDALDNATAIDKAVEVRPWMGYPLNTDDPDPKAMRKGWMRLLRSATDKIRAQAELDNGRKADDNTDDTEVNDIGHGWIDCGDDYDSDTMPETFPYGYDDTLDARLDWRTDYDT